MGLESRRDSIACRTTSHCRLKLSRLKWAKTLGLMNPATGLYLPPHFAQVTLTCICQPVTVSVVICAFPSITWTLFIMAERCGTQVKLRGIGGLAASSRHNLGSYKFACGDLLDRTLGWSVAWEAAGFVQPFLISARMRLPIKGGTSNHSPTFL
jgi:hypothetical protein